MPVFVDTNIALYAISTDPREAAKRDIAYDILQRDDFRVSTQVLLEFYAQATRPGSDHRISHERFVETRARDTRVILWRKPGGRLVFSAASGNQKPQKNDVILSFAPPRPKKDVPAVTDAKPQPDLPDAQAP